MKFLQNIHLEGYRDVFTQKQYMKLLSANIINRFGDSIDSITFTWLTYAITGSASWSAVMFGLNQLPSIIVQPLAGAWVENTDKKKVMAFTDLLRGLLMTAFGAAYFFNILTPWLMAAITLAISTAEAFRTPAGTGIIPQIIDLKYYAFGSSLNTTLCRLVEITGTGLSAVILATAGVGLALAIDILSYFISAIIILCIHPVTPGDMDKEKPRSMARGTAQGTARGMENYVKTLKGGLAYIKENPLILNFCFLGITANGMLVPLNALMTPMITQLWGQGAPALSVFGTALTIGLCIGGALYPILSKDKNPRLFIVTGGIILAIAYALLAGGGLIKTASTVSMPLLAVIALWLGFGTALISSAFGVSLIKCISKDYLSRVSAFVNASAAAAMPVLSFIISALALALPIAVILLTGAFLFAFIFLFIAIRKVEFQ